MQIRSGQHYMPTSGHGGLVVILGETEDKNGWHFEVTWADKNKQNSTASISNYHLEQEINSGKFKLIYDPPDSSIPDLSVRNRLMEIE